MYKRILSFILKICSLLFVWSIVYTIYLAMFNPLITATQLNSILKGDGLKREFINYNDISNSAKIALLASEDYVFTEHQGFDFEGIKDAFAHNQNHKRIHGASTITQQLAKNIFLWQGRSYLRKGLEVYFTILLESFLSKKRILALYLNSVEFGRGIYGIQAASQYYYKKLASQLTPDQSIRLILCLPSPKKRSPFKLGKISINRYNIVVSDFNNLRRNEIVKKYIF